MSQANDERPSPGSPHAMRLVGACRGLYEAVDQLDELAAQSVGVSRSDLRALNSLEHGPLAPSELARRLSLTTGAITTLVDRLEAKGFVRRVPSTTDRRGVIIEPLPPMYERLGPIYLRLAKSLGETADAYSARELKAAVRHLGDVRGAFEQAIAGLEAESE